MRSYSSLCIDCIILNCSGDWLISTYWLCKLQKTMRITMCWLLLWSCDWLNKAHSSRSTSQNCNIVGQVSAGTALSSKLAMLVLTQPGLLQMTSRMWRPAWDSTPASLFIQYNSALQLLCLGSVVYQCTLSRDCVFSPCKSSQDNSFVCIKSGPGFTMNEYR